MPRLEIRRRYRHVIWKILSKLSSRRVGTVRTTVLGRQMYLDLSDRVHCETLYTNGIWERDVTALLKNRLRPGMNVVDIGANVGYYTLLAAAAVGRTGKVFAFEPEPSRYRLLEKNIRANGLTNVIAVNKAISNTTGGARLSLDPGHNPADHRLFDTDDHRSSIAVETVRLDDFLAGRELPIDVIKMDIQGAEYAALQGMTQTIHENRDLMIITEFWPAGIEKAGFSPTGFLRLLIDGGFELHTLGQGQQHRRTLEPEQVLARCQDEIYLVCRKRPAVRTT